jgi:hypothetical protein
MQVCTNGCTCVSMYVWMDLCTYVFCIHLCLYACMYVPTYLCMYSSMFKCMYVCTFICKHVCMHITYISVVEEKSILKNEMFFSAKTPGGLQRSFFVLLCWWLPAGERVCNKDFLPTRLATWTKQNVFVAHCRAGWPDDSENKSPKLRDQPVVCQNRYITITVYIISSNKKLQPLL